MTVKAAVAKDWSTWLPSFDGLIYSLYPSGNKPSGFSGLQLINTDKMSGALTGHVGNNGAVLHLFGRSFGRSDQLGTTAGSKVFLRDPTGDNTWHEVATYWYLAKSAAYLSDQTMDLCVQVGSLGGSQTAGHALDVKVTTNSVDSNILFSQFVIQPGDFYYVSLTGSDTTGVKNNVNLPFQSIQTWNGSVFSGVYPNLQGGDTMILRGGNWTAQQFDNRWFRFWTLTGSAATGTVGHGPIGFEPMPTLFGPESVHHTGALGGGIHGCDTARAEAGWGKYANITCMHIETGANAARDSGPINLQNGADFWRVTNCELGPWPSALVTPNNAKSAAIGGQGSNFYIAFNNCHDIDCDVNNPGSSALENHGCYMGGATGGVAYDAASKNGIIEHNWFHAIRGGSTLQFYWQGSAATSVFTGNIVRFNRCDGAQKYGINCGQSSVSCDVYGNIVSNCGLAALRFEGLSYSAGVNTFAMNFEQNTCVDWNQRGSITGAAFLTEGYANTGAIKVRHNIFALTATHSTNDQWYLNSAFGGADANVSGDQNLCWDSTGVLTGSYGTNPIVTNPNFTNVSAQDFTCQSGGGGIDALTTTESVSVTQDFYGITKPQGAHKDIGACEGIGT
jgi:hypothetical protein